MCFRLSGTYNLITVNIYSLQLKNSTIFPIKFSYIFQLTGEGIEMIWDQNISGSIYLGTGMEGRKPPVSY